jgi:hypothetical protein
LLATTTWQKPFTFSISIMFLIVCGEHVRVRRQGHQLLLYWAPSQGPRAFNYLGVERPGASYLPRGHVFNYTPLFQLEGGISVVHLAGQTG